MAWIERLIFPIFLITSVVGLSYWYWTTTPSYCVQQVVNSVRAHDVATFTRYVDLDTMGERALDEIIHGPAKDAGLFGNLDSFIGMGIVSLFKSEIVEMFKTEVTRLVAGDNSGKPGDNKSDAGVAKPFVISWGNGGAAYASPLDTQRLLGGSKSSKLSKWKQDLEGYGLSKQGFRGIDYFKEENGVNLIGLKFHTTKYNSDFTIEFKLEDAGGYWRVTELSNLSHLVEQYIDLRDSQRADPAPAVEVAPAVPVAPASTAPATSAAAPARAVPSP